MVLCLYRDGGGSGGWGDQCLGPGGRGRGCGGVEGGAQGAVYFSFCLVPVLLRLPLSGVLVENPARRSAVLRTGLFSSAGAGVLGALWLAGVLVLAAAPGCAQGSDDDLGDPGGTGPGSGGSSGTGGPAATGAGGSATTGGGGMGSGGSGSPCGAQEHMCGGICTGNTPESGCFSNTTCDPCTAPANGTATCTTTGLCDFECTAPYQKNGAACTCPSMCCSNAECTGGLQCMSGTCACATECCSANDCASYQTCTGGSCACDQAGCLAYCIASGMGVVGICNILNQQCVCGN